MLESRLTFTPSLGFIIVLAHDYMAKHQGASYDSEARAAGTLQNG
jgi:hypothetical protein